MKPWWMRYVLRKPEGEASGGGGAAPAPAPAEAAPAASPAPAASAPAPAAAAPAASAPAAAPASSPAAGPAASKADTKGIWPENWRETVSKDDAKRLAQLQRYASPEAALQALFAAQDRIRSGELLPKLGKNATAEELAEWREAHGIPAAPDKYDLGKDVKVDEADKALFDVMFKALHGANATPDVVKATVQTWNQVKKIALDAQAANDKKNEQDAEDALRTEFGENYRRNLNLFHSALDRSMSKDAKELFLGGRLADGTPIGSSPAVIKAVLGLELLANPRGTIVGGEGAGEKGARKELEDLQKVPTAKKTEAQSQRQRELIDWAVSNGHMDTSGNWKN